MTRSERNQNKQRVLDAIKQKDACATVVQAAELTGLPATTVRSAIRALVAAGTLEKRGTMGCHNAAGYYFTGQKTSWDRYMEEWDWRAGQKVLVDGEPPGDWGAYVIEGVIDADWVDISVTYENGQTDMSRICSDRLTPLLRRA